LSSCGRISGQKVFPNRAIRDSCSQKGGRNARWDVMTRYGSFFSAAGMHSQFLTFVQAVPCVAACLDDAGVYTAFRPSSVPMLNAMLKRRRKLAANTAFVPR
jgi:hypothetical protein